MVKVMVFGTFDGVHPGHINLFEQARMHGDTLTVVVARDITVKAVKGRSPKYDETERLAAVRSHSLVDRAVLGNVDDMYKIISELRPDVICLGYDQHSFTDELESKLDKRGLVINIHRLESFRPDKYKSSKLK